MRALHCHVKVGRAGKAGPHASYVSRLDKYESMLERGAGEELVHVEHGNMPKWADSPMEFWKESDARERKGGTTYREFEIDLPRDFSKEQQIEFCQNLARDKFGDQYAYTFGIHNKTASDGQPQPHVHMMFSERRQDGIERGPDQFFSRYNSKHPERGGCKKESEFSTAQTMTKKERADVLREFRADVADRQNKMLEKAGSADRVTALSNKDRGIDAPPGEHLGPKKWAMQQRVNQLKIEIQEIRNDLTKHEREQARRQFGEARKWGAEKPGPSGLPARAGKPLLDVPKRHADEDHRRPRDLLPRGDEGHRERNPNRVQRVQPQGWRDKLKRKAAEAKKLIEQKTREMRGLMSKLLQGEPAKPTAPKKAVTTKAVTPAKQPAAPVAKPTETKPAEPRIDPVHARQLQESQRRTAGFLEGVARTAKNPNVKGVRCPPSLDRAAEHFAKTKDTSRLREEADKLARRAAAGDPSAIAEMRAATGDLAAAMPRHAQAIGGSFAGTQPKGRPGEPQRTGAPQVDWAVQSLEHAKVDLAAAEAAAKAPPDQKAEVHAAALRDGQASMASNMAKMQADIGRNAQSGGEIATKHGPGHIGDAPKTPRPRG